MTNRFDHELDTHTLQKLEKLRYQVRRNETLAGEGRAKFIAQVKSLTSRPVSKRLSERLIGWMFIPNLLQRKELNPMFATLGTLMVILALVFGGAGATVHAAQGSLPDETLYPVKEYSEQIQLALTTRSQDRLRLLLRFSDQRVEEMLDLLAESKPIPPKTQTRLEQHYQLAFQAVMGMDEPAMSKALQQVESHVRLQEQRLQGASSSLPEAAKPALEQIRGILRQQLRRLDEGWADSQRLHLRSQERQQTEAPPIETSKPPLPGAEENGSGYGDGLELKGCPACTPALDGTGPGPAGTPECDDCTPVMDGTGPGPGPFGTPECDDCTPALDGTGPGPGPQNQGETSQPGGQPADPPGTGGGTSEGGTTGGGSGGIGGGSNHP